MLGLDAFAVIGTTLAIASQVALLVMLCRDGHKPVLAFLCLWPLSGIYFLAKDPSKMRVPRRLLIMGIAFDFVSNLSTVWQ